MSATHRHGWWTGPFLSRTGKSERFDKLVVIQEEFRNGLITKPHNKKTHNAVLIESMSEDGRTFVFISGR